MRYVFDIEAPGLLDDSTIDYTSSPYVLRPNFNIHCIVVQDIDSDRLLCFYDGETYTFDGREHSEVVEGITYSLSDYKPVTYEHRQLKEFKQFVLDNPDSEVIGHNILGYDLLALKLTDNMDYTVKHELEGTDTWCGLDMTFSDTMIMSKVFNADRVGSHSLDNLAKLTKKDEKFEFRKGMKKDDKFKHFAGDMVYYCLRDGIANKNVYNYLKWEESLDDWNWKPALCLEHKIMEIVTRSSHRGFAFDKDLAEKCIKELDELMQERKDIVEPLLPPRKATKKFLGDHTPPKSQILEKDVNIPASFLSKTNLEITKTGLTWLERNNAQYDEDTYTITVKGNKIKRDSSEGFPKVGYVEKTIAAHMKKFVTKHNGSWDEDNLTVTVFDKKMKLPIDAVPLKDTMPMRISDSSAIKEWLVSLGWSPSSYTMNDITLKSGTKIKRTPEELDKAVDRYVMETLESQFCKDRCEHLKARPTYHSLRSKIMKKAEKYGCKVLTSPSLTVGADKELCPVLERISEEFSEVKNIVEHGTFKHRRNSILGGGAAWEDGEEADKGFLAKIRADGRISTDCDTMGAGTGRMRHKGVVNVPRVSSLYGKNMRALFKVADNCFKVGADFASLEARGEGHYCHRYDVEGKPYCESLTLSQPFDVHTITSQDISKVLGKPFGRTPAKSVKYGLTFGAMAAKIAVMLGVDLKTAEGIVDAFWDSAKPLSDLKAAVEKWWNSKGKKYIIGLDGRRVPTRFQHALLNSLFQSFGAIATKTMAVFYDKLLLDEGLMVDFFKDDWANMSYAQLMIIMHDEVAMEETKSNFKWKKFNSEEKALTFIEEDDKIWSEVIHGKNNKYYVNDVVFSSRKKAKGYIKEHSLDSEVVQDDNNTYHIGYSRASELIHTAVNMTNEHFKLKVPLEMGYVVGLDWSMTH